MPQNFYSKLEKLLKQDTLFIDQEGDLLKSNVIDAAYKADKKLVELLLSEKEFKSKFFNVVETEDVQPVRKNFRSYIFNTNKFVEYIQDKNFLADSYTKYRNKIGLNIDGKFLNERKEVALVWPFKDCVLEGGMTKEDEKRKEIFFNEILAQDEIDQLFAPKVLTNWKRYTQDGEIPLNPPFKKGEAERSEAGGFKRDKNGTIRENLIIKGNNLLALHSLKQQFQNKIKLIYIDPPYNTGNDSFGYNDNFNHSTWLTFMKNRLEAARELLKEDGVIFIQIDNNEQAYLKILCDEIFGRENFRNNIIWKKLTSAKSQSNYLANVTEFILFYSKSDNVKFYKQYLETDKEIEKRNYPYVEEKTGRRYGSFDFTQTGQGGPRKFNGKLLYPPQGKHWIWTQEKIDKGIKNGLIIFTKNGTPRLKRYLDEKKGNYLSDLWSDKEVAPISANDIERISGFDGQKKETMIKRILDISTKENDIVLDFFLGSGTTAIVAHKMGRQYIGIEQLDYGKNDAVVRLQNVIGKKKKKDGKMFKKLEYDQSGISKAVGWKGGGSFIYCELMKYNERFVEKITAAKNSLQLQKIWKEMSAKGAAPAGGRGSASGGKASAFLNYNVDIEKFDETIDEFKKLPLAKQKRILFDLLNKNQLYVNLSEIEDKEFKVGEGDKRMNKEFYG